MKRWNGWGDDGKSYPLADRAIHLMRQRLGQGDTTPDARLDEVLAAVPESRLAEHPLLVTDPVERVRHARGQSLPDWVAIRTGRIGLFPDGVAYPSTREEVRALIGHAQAHGSRIIPYGGGTSVVGHINPLTGDRPVLTLDLRRLSELHDLDEVSCLATFGAGVTGPDLEARLRQHGLTLGHYPQSFEYSTLGGWVATRSCGQQSYYYGRIESLFAGGWLEMPRGSLEIKPIPASAAGPDLRHLFLGSEGRLGVITEVVVRIRRLPDVESFHGVMFRDWPSGVEAVRELVQVGTPLSMVRLSDPLETETTFALAGRERLVDWAGRAFRALKYGQERCLLLFGVTGDRKLAREARRRASSISRRHGGLPIGRIVGETWRKSRFLTPYLRNTLWEQGYAVDTLETAIPWSGVLETAAGIKEALTTALDGHDERVLAFAHLSHIYIDGASIYITLMIRRCADPEEMLERWRILKMAASQVIIAHRGTISHQHGVGEDHLPYMMAEKGGSGLMWLESVRRYADPDRMMNPGKLLPDSNDDHRIVNDVDSSMAR